MIAHLKGHIIHLDLKFLVLDVSGVGYKVYVSTPTTEKLSVLNNERKEVSLYTYLAVREDALDLYGFLSREEQDFFELLLTISGIGPKSAISILNVATVDTLKEAIYNDDPSYLTKVSGLGKKSAEKIVRELKEKVEYLPSKSPTESAKNQSNNTSLIEALMALGFSGEVARNAAKKTDRDSSLNEQIKQALKFLQ